MIDLEQRVKMLEDKVKVLEETLETLKNMQISNQMKEYIQSKTKTLQMAELVNLISDKPELDLSKEQDAVKEIQINKRSIDEKIAKALNSSNNYSEQCATDVKYFEYEIENGKGDYDRPINKLSKHIGKGIRITAYNGFDCEHVIVPPTIDGLPITSIGERVFINSPISKVILPDSIKAILGSAFSGCKNLKRIELPKELRYLGSFVFSGSGLTTISIPDSVTFINSYCFTSCTSLASVSFGKNLIRIESCAFERTAIQTYIFPKNTQSISEEIFGSTYYPAQSIELVFLSEQTYIGPNPQKSFVNGLCLQNKIKTIYCLPGSMSQKFAREHNIPIKPLSEFNGGIK